jgi:Mn2+/Fe2+ NRAMP family transporter
MAAVQMMCARIGKVTGQGLAGNFKQRFPRWLLLAFVIALLAANTINIAADLAGMADAASMLSGQFPLVCCGLCASHLVGNHPAPVSADRERAQVACACAFAYPVTAFVVGTNWGQVLRDTLIPSMPHTRNGWATLVAILGTTISPYLFFWQASEEVEEEKSAGQSSLALRRGATPGRA